MPVQTFMRTNGLVIGYFMDWRAKWSTLPSQSHAVTWHEKINKTRKMDIASKNTFYSACTSLCCECRMFSSCWWCDGDFLTCFNLMWSNCILLFCLTAKCEWDFLGRSHLPPLLWVSTLFPNPTSLFCFEYKHLFLHPEVFYLRSDPDTSRSLFWFVPQTKQ